jgi:hypothetical protein
MVSPRDDFDFVIPFGGKKWFGWNFRTAELFQILDPMKAAVAATFC